MRREAQPPADSIYRPCNSWASSLYQCAQRHGEELGAADLMYRPAESQVLERFLACDDLHQLARDRPPVSAVMICHRAAAADRRSPTG